MHKNRWQKLNSKYLLENPWYKVRQDVVIQPNGKEGTYNIIECKRSVFILPITADHRLVLIKLFRYPTQREGWEIPAGGVEDNEKPLVAAKRELQEETGLIGKTWRKLGSFDSMNGIAHAVADIYEARELKTTHQHSQDEEGVTATQAFNIQEVMKMIQKGEIVDSLSIAAVLYFLAHYKDNNIVDALMEI